MTLGVLSVSAVVAPSLLIMKRYVGSLRTVRAATENPIGGQWYNFSSAPAWETLFITLTFRPPYILGLMMSADESYSCSIATAPSVFHALDAVCSYKSWLARQ